MTTTHADSSRILDAVGNVVVGHRDALTLALAAIVAGGHVLLEDLPGLGKTLAARTLASVLGLGFKRAQFTPDLMPSDLTGSFVFDQRTATFDFRPGPVFTGLLLADEINRTPPKTQAALLEAMQEGQVTVEGQTFALPRPFHVIATANPIEHEGTYPLPEAQLDRFLLRIAFGYPTAQDEAAVVERQLSGTLDDVPAALGGPDMLLEMQARARIVHVDPAVVDYAVALVRATREHAHASIGASPRGTLALIRCAQALALLDGRSFTTPADVQRLAHAALDHRVSVRPELWLSGATATGIVDDALRSVPVPDALRTSGQAAEVSR